MIRSLVSNATQVAAVIGAFMLASGGMLPPSVTPLWAQAPLGPNGIPYGAGPNGAMPLSPYSSNNPQSYNNTLGSPLAPTQSSRPAGWPGGGETDPPSPPPTRKNFARPFGAPGAATAGGAAGNSTGAAQLADNAIVRSAALVLLEPPDKIKYEGAEIIGRVGAEIILAADVLYETNRMMERFMAANQGKQIPTEMLDQGRIIFMKKNLERLIETKLLFAEALRNIPPEALPKIEKQFNDQFDKQFLRKIMEGEGVGSRTELEAKLRRQGTTVTNMRRQAFEGSFAARWMDDHVKNDDEITHADMTTYYRQHFAEYERPRRVRWEHLMARFDKFPSKAEAFQALAGWGNQVVKGASFADVAKANSHDLSAADGGVHSWTNEGALKSGQIDRALFSLPVGQLSQIIEDDRGFHIVRIIEREDITATPFVDSQAEIRQKIREERNEDRRKEYLEGIRAKTPVWTIFDPTEVPQTASRPAPPRR